MARRADPRNARRVEHLEELAALRARVGEAEDLLRAIGRGEVDAIVRQGPAGDQVFTLEGADRPYRTMVETMAEGALSLTTDGAILYANARFAELVGCELDQIIGASITGFVAPHDATRIRRSPAPRVRRHRQGASSIAARRRRVVPGPDGVARPGWRRSSDHRRDRHRTGGGAARHRHRRAGTQGGENSHGRDRRRRAAHASRGAARTGARPVAIGRRSERRIDRPGRSEAAHRHGEQGVHGHHRHQRGEGCRSAF